MHHIFYIQSNLSLVVCRAIIDKKSIEPNKIFMICDRGVKLPHRLRGIEINPSWCGEYFAPNKNFFLLRFRLLYLDKIIKIATNDEYFQLYINEMTHHMLSLFRTNRWCLGINLYEEGLASYVRPLFSKSKLKTTKRWNYFKGKLLCFLCYGNRYTGSGQFYSDNYSKAYCSSDLAFEGFPRKEVININNVLAGVGMSLRKTVKVGAVIYALKPLKTRSGIQADTESMNNFLSIVASIGTDEQSLYLKRHPACFLDQKEWDEILVSITQNHQSLFISELESDTYLEALFFGRPDLKLITEFSSTGIYANRFGCKVISYLPIELAEKQKELLVKYQRLTNCEVVRLP